MYLFSYLRFDSRWVAKNPRRLGIKASASNQEIACRNELQECSNPLPRCHGGWTMATSNVRTAVARMFRKSSSDASNAMDQGVIIARRCMRKVI
jgi:hypothetical protein